MKLLLTSNGITNDSMRLRLEESLQKKLEDAEVAFIPTAAFGVTGSHSWFVHELNQLVSLGWKEFHLAALNGLPHKTILSQLDKADVLFSIGGNAYHLADSIKKNSLTESLHTLLKEKVYLGSSAGSMIFSKHLNRSSATIFNEANELDLIEKEEVSSPFNYFDWYVKPHMYSDNFPERTDEWLEVKAAQAGFPIYAIDDQTAIWVTDNELEIISEGNWRYIA